MFSIVFSPLDVLRCSTVLSTLSNRAVHSTRPVPASAWMAAASSSFAGQSKQTLQRVTKYAVQRVMLGKMQVRCTRKIHKLLVGVGDGEFLRRFFLTPKSLFSGRLYTEPYLRFSLVRLIYVFELICCQQFLRRTPALCSLLQGALLGTRWAWQTPKLSHTG